ncbi:hypothetical protein BTIS_1646 [Bifidobacterium tissieri]|uniref:Uncharacterized protein n=2 Tax=Bifidobacterium tissieri TaxID=1630162 RepID=A0A261FCY0_9BIFI|nr:hypothetical protein BTIS_1646 [Bifidobacterium tissieri]
MLGMEEAKQRQRGKLFTWCLIANVVDEHEVGQDHHIEYGTKIFSPGTKVYVSSWWDNSTKDDGGVLYVIGKARKQWRLVAAYIARDRLTNFRAKQVFDPKALRRMAQDEGQNRVRPGQFVRWWGKDEEARRRVEQKAAYYNQDIYSVRRREWEEARRGMEKL